MSSTTEVQDDKHEHRRCLCAGPNPTLTPGNSPPQAVKDGQGLVLDPDVVATVEAKIAELSTELREVSLKVHARPELAFQENYAHDVMTEFMEKHGFTVTRHYAGLETAWRAEFTVGSGGRVLGVNSEMDALPGIGHACGHNLIGICGLGTAVAVKEALVAHDIAGKVILLGTPAEEDGGGKLILIDRDAYQEMDVCVMAHPGPGPPNFVSNGTMSAAGFIYAEYRGKPAHAAGSPWEGINALDAAVTAYSAISSLRQQMKPDLRVHGIIEGNDWAPNIIPDNAKLTYIVRAPSKDELEALIERLEGCFNGAAMTAGCTVDIKVIPPYLDLRQNSVLFREFGANVSGRYDMTIINLNSPASTDFGNVSYGEYTVMPSIHPLYAVPTEVNGGNHTPQFTHSAQTQEAHDVTLKVAKGLALTGLRVLTDSAFYEEVKASFEAENEVRRIAKLAIDQAAHRP